MRPITSSGSLLELDTSPLVNKWRTSVWVEAFILTQICCQFLLLFGPSSIPRGPVRIASFGTSLLLLLFIPARKAGPSHPSIPAAELILFIMVLSFFHPGTNSFLSGGAQVALYFAILAPLFWVARLSINLSHLRRILLIIWLFHSVSALFGVLQVYYPGEFQPNLSQILAARPDYVGGLYIKLENGQRLLRPMGLTDTPGGAAVAGFYAVIFGMGFFLTFKRLWQRALCAGSMALGMMCLYMAQVRAHIVMGAICILVFGVMLAWARRGDKLALLAVVLSLVIVGSFSWAVIIGGSTVTDRLYSLIADRPDTIYYSNRGMFLQHTIDQLLPLYPLGAGLGRWGMTSVYFGDSSDPESAPIWAEIQWTGWLLDGGIPLILVYIAAIFIALKIPWKIAVNRRRGDLQVWGALFVAYNIGVIALTFSYPIFISQQGLEFWLLNACLFAAAQGESFNVGRKGLRNWQPT